MFRMFCGSTNDSFCIYFTSVVITRGMRSLPAVTVCFWMKTADAGKEGTPLSYAVSGRGNELSLLDYGNLKVWVSGRDRYTRISISF